MRIRTDRFCALATATDWQTWLFKYNEELYKEFITRLRLTRGCGDNRVLMEEFLDRIRQEGRILELVEFLQINYPHSLVDSSQPSIRDGNELDKLFSRKILTYPKRKILVGPSEKLPQLIMDFVSDKITYKSLVSGDRAYIEYLDKGEEHLLNQIPAKNWLLKGAKNG
jgi:hypothetical protein